MKSKAYSKVFSINLEGLAQVLVGQAHTPVQECDDILLVLLTATLLRQRELKVFAESSSCTES